MKLGFRQRCRIRLARARRWEFWPAWLFYIPVIVWILLLGLRHRSFTLFTAANPGMDDGGVVGERKSPLLLTLRESLPARTPPLRLLPAGLDHTERWPQAREFIEDRYPVVLKPDIGQRGRGVLIAHNAKQVERYLAHADFDVIVQKHAAGKEFGVFAYRDPDTDRPEVFSITAKELIHVHGDGQRTLAELIMNHPRAWLQAPMLLRRHEAELSRVPAAGEAFYLVDVGSHCRGAVFLDANRLNSPELGRCVAEIMDALPGFAFGRLDLIAPDRQALREAQGLQIIEINGVTAEAAHVYHPGTPLREGYRCFFQQWQLAFAVGRANRERGAEPVSGLRLLQLFVRDLQRYADADAACAAARRN